MVKLFDAMAEFAELPDYVPGRTEIPLPLETMLGERYAGGVRGSIGKKT